MWDWSGAKGDLPNKFRIVESIDESIG